MVGNACFTWHTLSVYIDCVFSLRVEIVGIFCKIYWNDVKQASGFIKYFCFCFNPSNGGNPAVRARVLYHKVT